MEDKFIFSEAIVFSSFSVLYRKNNWYNLVVYKNIFGCLHWA